jgi:mono/diheme cytochrome c family protein
MAFSKKQLGIGVLACWFVGSIASSFAHSNPPVTHKVAWDSPKTEKLFKQVCADCHSNETVWPWYSHVAPMSFAIVHHVNEGREHFNVSANVLDEAHEAAEEYEEGEMPESGYITFHPEADLSDADRQALINGLKRTFGDHGHGHGEGHDHEHGDHHH